MKILIIVILIDIFIFSLGAIFADREHEIVDNKQRNYHIDRYGYYWKVGE